jgi:hypothetical protein
MQEKPFQKVGANMLRQETFNLNLGLLAMQAGQDDAACARPTVLGVARAAAIAAAQAGNGTATADDAYRGLIAAGYKAQDLGNAAGALFQKTTWEFSGAYKRSARVSNHGRMNRVWRLVDFTF